MNSNSTHRSLDKLIIKTRQFLSNSDTTTFFIIVGALLLRLILINSSFWLDEAAQALESIRPLSQQLQIQNDFQPPLYH